MSEPVSSSVAAELIRIHLVITRGLKVAAESSQSFAQQGFPDVSAKEGFINYVRSLASTLHAHHLTEDDVAFPYFREKMLEAPFDLLSAQHQAMVLLLNEINSSIEPMELASQVHEPLSNLHRTLTQIAEIWHPHIKMEEDHFTPERVDALINPEEQTRLCGLFIEHSQKHARPDYLVVPFLLYNLPPQERAAFAQRLPPVVVQQLIPVLWKEKWETMKPFLLP